MVPPKRATPSAGSPAILEVTDSVEPIAVRMATMSWMMYLIVSFFIVLRAYPRPLPEGKGDRLACVIGLLMCFSSPFPSGEGWGEASFSLSLWRGLG